MTGSPTALKKCKQCTQLAFDIETLGLNGHRDPVTIVCLENEFGDRHAFEFARVRWECMANDRDQTLEIARMVEEMSLVFDAAASLVAFNGKILEILKIPKIFKIASQKRAVNSLQKLLLYRYAEDGYIYLTVSCVQVFVSTYRFFKKALTYARSELATGSQNVLIRWKLHAYLF